MESALKTIILDFYGFPGSGKSTVSHAFSEVLRHRNYCVEEPTYKLDHCVGSIRRKLLKITRSIIYSMSHIENGRTIVKSIRREEKCRFTRRLSNFINISNKLYCIDKMNGKCDFLIFDEGLVQSILSLSLEMETVRHGIKGILPLCEVEETTILVAISNSVALERMSQRSEHHARIEKIKEKATQICILRKMEKLFQLVKPSLILNGEESIEVQIHNLILHFSV